MRNIRRLVQTNGSIAFLTVKRDMDFIFRLTSTKSVSGFSSYANVNKEIRITANCNAKEELPSLLEKFFFELHIIQYVFPHVCPWLSHGKSMVRKFPNKQANIYPRSIKIGILVRKNIENGLNILPIY